MKTFIVHRKITGEFMRMMREYNYKYHSNSSAYFVIDYENYDYHRITMLSRDEYSEWLSDEEHSFSFVE